MTNTLPINLNDLLRWRTVEGERIEYKAGWNPAPSFIYFGRSHHEHHLCSALA
jgi:hypothetical protein